MDNAVTLNAECKARLNSVKEDRIVNVYRNVKVIIDVGMYG